MVNVVTQLNKANVDLPRGRWVELTEKTLPTGKGPDTKIQGQFRLRVPADATRLDVRFVRVFPDGKRDGTGDQAIDLTPFRGESFPWTWNHSVANGNFRWAMEAKVAGAGNATWAYRFAKSYQA